MNFSSPSCIDILNQPALQAILNVSSGVNPLDSPRVYIAFLNLTANSSTLAIGICLAYLKWLCIISQAIITIFLT